MKHKYGICCVIGIKADVLGDTDAGSSDVAKQIRSTLRGKFDELIKQGYRIFVFSGSTGTSMWAHQSLLGAGKAGIRRVLVIESKDWEPSFAKDNESQRMSGYFAKMVKHSNKVVYCNGGDVNQYLINHSDMVLAITYSNNPKAKKSLDASMKYCVDNDKELVVLDIDKMKFSAT